MKFWPVPFKPWTYLISHIQVGLPLNLLRCLPIQVVKTNPKKGLVTVIGMFRHSGRFCVDNDTQLDGKESHLKF